MIKGAKKEMIVVRTGNSRYFDEAYFVLRHAPKENRQCHDLLAEANRILCESTVLPKREAKHRRLFFFLAGMLAGSLCTLGLCLCLL